VEECQLPVVLIKQLREVFKCAFFQEVHILVVDETLRLLGFAVANKFFDQDLIKNYLACRLLLLFGSIIRTRHDVDEEDKQVLERLLKQFAALHVRLLGREALCKRCRRTAAVHLMEEVGERKGHLLRNLPLHAAVVLVCLVFIRFRDHKKLFNIAL